MAEIACLWHGISMSKPTRSELFSWRLPFFFALLLVVSMGASFAWANSGPARFYTDPSHAAAECNVAASLAAELTAEQPGAIFRPTLVGIAPDLQFKTLYSSAKAVFVWPLEFDCSDSFAKRSLSVAVNSPSWNGSLGWYSFSRVALSDGDRVATVGITALFCSPECGGAQYETVWRSEGRRWFLVKRINTAIIN